MPARHSAEPPGPERLSHGSRRGGRAAPGPRHPQHPAAVTMARAGPHGPAAPSPARCLPPSSPPPPPRRPLRGPPATAAAGPPSRGAERGAAASGLRVAAGGGGSPLGPERQGRGLGRRSWGSGAEGALPGLPGYATARPKSPVGLGLWEQAGWKQSLCCCPACVPGALGCSAAQLVGLVGWEAPSNTLLLRFPRANYPSYLQYGCLPNA